MPKKEMPEKDLLELAMSSLDAQVEQKKRQRIFAANQRAVDQVKNHHSTVRLVESLQVKPSVHGEADSQSSLPLVLDNSYEIDLSKINLPSKIGGTSLQTLIDNLCRQHQIEANSRETSTRYASFNPVVTALPGMHADSDVECASVTKAEFVPVFDSGSREKRVLAISFSLNGETGIRTDVMKVRHVGTCLGRGTGGRNNSTALQAIEIPNQFAMHLREARPEQFAQLQNNACMVVFVEFDLREHIQFRGYSSPFGGGGRPVTMGGGGGGLTRGGGITKGGFSLGGGDGVSAYSVVGQGSHTADHSDVVTEYGERILSKISVYVVGAMVVNTNEQQLTHEQSDTVVNMMKMRVQELSSQYKAFEACTYNGFVTEVNRHLEQYGVNTSHSDIVEHTFFRFANQNVNPNLCEFIPGDDSKYVELKLGLPYESVEKICNGLQARFGKEFCDFPSQPSFYRYFRLRISLDAIKKQMDEIKRGMSELLSDSHLLTAFRRYSLEEKSLYDSVLPYFRSVIGKQGITSNTDCVEMILLKMVGCNEELHAARFAPGEDYIGKMMDMHLFLDISTTAALNLINQFNAQFSSLNYLPVRFIRPDARVNGKGEVDLRELAIDSRLLLSKEFQAQFELAFDNMIEDDPLLIEELRFQSGSRGKRSKDCVADLMKVATHLQEPANQPLEIARAKHNLAEALVMFSSILTVPTGKNSARLAASDQVRRSINQLEATQDVPENKEFKKGDKAIIKEAQKSLRLR